MCVYSRHFYDPYIPAIPGLEKFKGFPFLTLYNMYLLCKAKESDIFKTNYLCTWQQNTFDICFDLQIPKHSLLLQHVISLTVRVRIY